MVDRSPRLWSSFTYLYRSHLRTLIVQENDVNEISGDHHDIRTHGFYVPPTALFLPLRDRVCTRFGTSNYMVENASTFGVEMTETDLILEKERKASLVLVDELGRGTASDEVCALA